MGMMYFELLCMYISDCAPPFGIPGSAPAFWQNESDYFFKDDMRTIVHQGMYFDKMNF